MKEELEKAAVAAEKCAERLAAKGELTAAAIMCEHAILLRKRAERKVDS